MAFAIKSNVLPVAILGLVVGASLLFLSLPRTVDAVLMIPANSVLLKLQNRESASKNELSMVIDSKLRALSWGEDGRKWADLAVAQLLLADQIDDYEKSQELNIEAQKSLRHGLALRPADAFAWTRLAHAEYLVSGPSDRVAAAIQMAILTAPYAPSLLFVRLQLSFLVWPHFAPEDHDLIFQQVRLAWKNDPNRLLALARDLHQIGLVRTALSALAGEEARFSVLLRQPPS